jgi:molybdate transport system substrate-binding protein
MNAITVMSGGAAHGLVKRLEPGLLAATGCRINGTFSAVGGLRACLLAGEAADVVILTAAIIRELQDKGLAASGGSRDVGGVSTAVAVREGDPQPSIATPEELRAALLAASGIYFPDPVQATAGIHFANVLRRLGIAEATADRHRTFPNGATAMAALAASGEPSPVGCTQLTEIVSTPGVTAIGDLPGELGLVTTYTAAVMSGTRAPEASRWLVDALAADGNAAIRHACGFA